MLMPRLDKTHNNLLLLCCKFINLKNNKQYDHPIYQSEDAYFRLYVLDTLCFEQKNIYLDTVNWSKLPNYCCSFALKKKKKISVWGINLCGSMGTIPNTWRFWALIRY